MRKIPNSNSETDMTGDQPPSTPRWVKVSGIIVLVLVLTFVVLRFTGHGPGSHGPGNHGTGGEPAEQIDHEAPGNHTTFGGDH